MKNVQEKVEHQKPSDVYAQMTDPSYNNYTDYPRDTRQCQNVKTLQKKNKADKLMNVFQMVSEKHPFVVEIIHSRENPLPSLNKSHTFISSNECVVGFDRTLLLGKCFVGTTVYKSNKDTRKGT
ncbi:LOW QUALITY PROTEIN: hypothetical protein MAR_024524, partial [Mya arenaria]